MSQENASQLKRALVTLQELRARLVSVETMRTGPIAIIGMACRFPGAGSIREFWELLENRQDAIQTIDRGIQDSPGRNLNPAYYNRVQYAGLVQNIDRFDPYFFGISPREAAAMDPQQRLLLQAAWEALEDAGQTVERLAGSATGVFVGAHSHSSDYYLLQATDLDSIDTYTGTGSAHNVLSGRLAFCFDLRGPNFTVDTACSSSLVAVHLACQSLRNGECNLAIAAGVNAILSPHFTVAASQMNMLAQDGRCKTFDAGADGFVRSEGCGVVVLKRLADALADGDTVLAVIRGSAINQDGHTNGLTAPNGLAQQAVIRQALENANVEPSQIGYVETHGTGTPLGDPIEVEALGLTVGKPAPDGQDCVLGAVKTNIGHLEGAAGIAGLIKTVLVLRHETIPGNLYFRSLNPHISLEGTRLVIADRQRLWRVGGMKRYAGVSSFGWSGTNAHVVLEQAPSLTEVEQFSPEIGEPYYLLPLSARSYESLEALAHAYKKHVSDSTARLPDICFSASVRASHHPYRLAVGGSTREEIAEKLASLQHTDGQSALALFIARPELGTVFIFPGQGSQWLGMGKQLLARERVFRDVLENCEQAFKPYVGWSLIEELNADYGQSRLNEIDVIQPALFAIQAALTALWRAWGIEPDIVVGHSMGEVTAGYVAGALQLEDAARIICIRSQLLKQISGRGAMLFVELSMQEASEYLQDYAEGVSIGVSNSPQSTVLSGDPAVLAEIQVALESRDIFCRPIKVDVAAHSPQVEPLCPELVRGLGEIRPHSGTVPMFSTVTAGRIDGRDLVPEYWARNLRQPVQFSPVVRQLLDLGHSVFIEASPHPMLLPAIEHSSVVTLPSMRRNEDERKVMLESLGELYALGKTVRWQAIYPSGHLVPRPAYPWRQERFWLQEHKRDTIVDMTEPVATDSELQNDLLGSRLDLANPTGGVTWENKLDSRRLPILYEHRLQGAAVLSASAYIAMARAASSEKFGDDVTLSSVEFKRALELDAETRTQLWLTPLENERAALQLYSHQAGEWHLHLNCEASRTETAGSLSAGDGQEAKGTSRPAQMDAIRAGCTWQSGGAEYYRILAAKGIEIGPASKGIRHVWQTDKEILAELNPGSEHAKGSEWAARLECCFHLLGNLSFNASEIEIPVGIRCIRFHNASGPGKWAYAERSGELSVNLRLLNPYGAPMVEMQGVQLEKWNGAVSATTIRNDWLYEIQWQLAPGQGRMQVGSESWLILGDTSGVGAELERLLEQEGHHCILVNGEDSLRSEQETLAEISARLEPVIQEIPDGGEKPLRGVIHLASLDTPSPDELTSASIEQAQVRGCGSALAIVQALARRDLHSPLRLWLVTRGAQAVGSQQAVNFVQAPLWGLGRTVAEEHNEFWGGLIDLDPAASPAESATQIRDQLRESSSEDQIAFRGGERFVARLRRFSSQHAARPFRWRPDAAYLITGGSGGLGLALARWAVDRRARHLILMGRTQLAPRTAWNQIKEGRALELVRTIQELEAQGASVHYAAVDVSNQAQLAGFFERFRREIKLPIAGVFHAANLFENQLLAQFDSDSLAAVIRPKLAGGWLLHRLLGDIDIMVFFSSIASLLPQSGQAAYAAANAGLDALAAYWRAQGKHVLNINWGIWEGVGSLWQTPSGARAAGELMGQGIDGLTTEQGLDVLDYLLDREPLSVIVMPADWNKFNSSRTGIRRQSFLSELTPGENTPQVPTERAGLAEISIRQELLNLPVELRQSRFQEYIQGQIAQVLRMSSFQIDPHAPLGSYGLDSLMAIELRNRLDNALGLKLSATLAWNYPTVSDLAVYLANKMEIPLADEGTVSRPENSPAGGKPNDRTGLFADIESFSEQDALAALRQRKVSGGRK